VTGAIAVVFAFGSQKEPIQAAVLPNGVEALPAPGEELVNVALMRDIENKLVLRGRKDAMKSDGQLDDPEIWAQMAANGLRILLGKNTHQLVAYLLG